ncbi:MAG: 50S ribosomal protein L18 [Patescibacteria group bacterium]|jgi:large subunit ribosomal protein L18
MITHDTKKRRLIKVRKQLATNIGIPRLTVFRSNKHLWAQIVDDKHGKTLVASSTKKLDLKKGTKLEQAQEVGKEIAKLASEKNIANIRFDRGLYRYHGRVKALADAAREGGLKF